MTTFKEVSGGLMDGLFDIFPYAGL